MAEKLEIQVLLRSVAGRQIAALQNSFTKFGNGVKRVGRTLTSIQAKFAALGVTLSTGLFLRSTIKVFADFDDTMRAVGAVSGATAEEFQQLTDIAKKMGATTKFSASEAAEGLRFLSMAGFDAQEATEALPGTLNLAAAGALELGQAADITTNILTGFGLEIDQLGSVNDVLVKTFTTSNTNLIELGEGFKLVGPIAAGVGADFEDLVGTLGKLADAGLKGTLGGTALRGAINALLNPTKEEEKLMAGLQGRMNGVALQTKDAEGNFIGFAEVIRQLEEAGLRGDEALELFGLRAGPAMAALLGIGGEELKEYTKGLRTAGGTSEDIAEQMSAGIGGAIRELKAAFEGFQIAFGEAFNDDMVVIVRKIRDWINKLTEEIKFLQSTGKLKEWAETAKQSIDVVVWVVQKLIKAFEVLGRLIGTVSLALSGNLDATVNSLQGFGKAVDDLLGIERNTVYKISKDGRVISETFADGTEKVREMTDEVNKLRMVSTSTADVFALRKAEAKYASKPIGKSKTASTGSGKSGDLPEADAKTILASEATKLQAIIDKEMAANEFLYSQGLKDLKTYFQDREDLLIESMENEIETQEARLKLEEDPSKREAINSKIFALEQNLQKRLLELTQERLEAETRLEEDKVKEEQKLKEQRIASEQAFADLKARVAVGDQGALEGKFQQELADLQERQNKELAIFNQGKIQEAELNEFYRLQRQEKDQLYEDQARRLMQYRLDSARQISGGIADIFGEMYELSGKKQKEFFYLMKAARIAEATINIANGVIGALGTPPYGYGAIATAAVIAGLGAVQIAKIVSTGYAEGGKVAGHSPTKTSDNISAKLTAGEYVHKVDAVNYYGKPVMDALNSMSIPREVFGGFNMPRIQPMPVGSHFAGGGSVQAGPDTGKLGSNQGQQVVVNNNNILDPAMFTQHMSTKTGEQDVFNVLTRNPLKLKQLVFAQQ